jgi:hypothetical protein
MRERRSRKKNAAKAERRLEDVLKITFEDSAEKYIAAHEKSWRNAKHRARWRSTLETYTYPEIGKLPVAAVDTALVNMGSEDLTTHGFRSTFRDWAAERTNFQREVVEAALAHTIGDKVEAAYLRSDFFDKRRRLMSAWAEFANTIPAPGTVVPIRSIAAG